MVQLVPHEGEDPYRGLWMHDIGTPPEPPHVPVGAGPYEHELSSVPILGPETPSAAARSSTTWDIAKRLHARGSAALKKMGVESGQLIAENRTPETDEILARTLAYETKEAMTRTGHAGNWYTSGVTEAVNTAARLYPEIASDEAAKAAGLGSASNARNAFLAAKAITSQGERVPANVKLTQQVYEQFRQTGRFPTNVRADKQKIMNNNFKKLNRLLDEIGPEKTWEFMHSDFTVRDLQAMGHGKIGGAAMDDVVKGSAILGPKIGNGFFQNLSGNFNPVTFDLWWMRGWGRLTGTLSGRPTAIPKARERLENALREEGRPVPRNLQGLSKLADSLVTQHERDFIRNRALYDSGEKKKSEITKAAERLQQNLHGIKQSPTSAGERRWMTGVVNRARELLEKEGYDVTNADIQALLWYPEKDLYAKMGSVPSDELNVNYTQAWRNVLRERELAQ
jgi:hypothetical protein